MSDADGSGGAGSGTNGQAGAGSGANGSGGSGSGTGGQTGGGSGAPTSGGAGLDDLTKGLKALQDSGDADLKISPEARDKYLQLVKTLRDAIQDQRNKMETVGPVHVALASAQQTKNNLDLDVTGTSGIQFSVDKYLDYLDTLSDTVKKAADRLIQAG